MGGRPTRDVMAGQRAGHPDGQDRGLPHRRTLTAVLALLALAGAAGAGQLVVGVSTPPVEDLEPLGLTTWVLPGIWLLVSVAVPSAVAAVATWQRRGRATDLALLAAGLLAVELVVQIPFVGPSPLQAVLGVVAALVAWLAVDARRAG